MENFIFKYYIEPILSRTGYNLVNTLTYALVAITILYLVYYFFKKNKIAVDLNFVYSVIPFVLLGSTIRVITDSIDGGKFVPITLLHQLILDSHIYDYGFLTSSPGIYLVIAFIFFASMFVLYGLKKQNLLWAIGTCLWAAHFILLVPFFKFWPFALPIIFLAAIPALLFWFYSKDKLLSIMVGSQALDGAATFLILDFSKYYAGIEYFEQHVVSNGVCSIFNTCATFYLLKLLVVMAAGYLLHNEKDANLSEKYFIALVVLIMGLAPGLRDLLRMIAGT